MDLLFTLRIARLNSPRFFIDLVFLSDHIIVFFIFPLLYIYDLCLFDLNLNNKPKYLLC